MNINNIEGNGNQELHSYLLRSSNVLEAEQRFLNKKETVNIQTSINIGNSTLLTAREIDIANCLLNGNTAKQTAKALFISPRTVERHLENMKDKLNCRNKFELVNKILNLTARMLQTN